MSTDLQYGDRRRTDAQRIVLSAPRTYRGVMDKHARFIEENQLFNETDWMLFVKQYKDVTDITAEDPIGRLGWRGEFFGKMMRGACMTYQYTKNQFRNWFFRSCSWFIYHKYCIVNDCTAKDFIFKTVNTGHAIDTWKCYRNSTACGKK